MGDTDTDKVMVKATLKWLITQEIVNNVRSRSEKAKSPLFPLRKKGGKLTFQLQLCPILGRAFRDPTSARAVCNLHLIEGNYANVDTWGITNLGLFLTNFDLTPGKSKSLSNCIEISAGNELVFDLVVTSTSWQDEDRNTKSLKADLSELFESGELSDVTLVCEDKKFKCHRTILGARSRVFRAMLSPDNGFKEGQAISIPIGEADPTTFGWFLSFLYGKDFDLDNMDLNLDLLELAERYDVPTLKEVCSESLMDHLSLDNYWQCLSRCALLNVPDLVKEILRKAVEDPKDLRNNKKWLELIKACPELTVALLDVVEEKLTK